VTNMDFVWLVFAHLVGDFVLQDEFQAKLKGKRLYILLVHSALWAGAVSLCLLALGLFAFWRSSWASAQRRLRTGASIIAGTCTLCLPDATCGKCRTSSLPTRRLSTPPTGGARA